MKYQFVIGAPSSNSGKTTLTLGLMRAFQKRNLTVQPFKCGPDYIDPKFHKLACGKESINLDSILMSPKHVSNSYHDYSKEAAVSVVEGVMGLFDGAVRSKGSTAELAKTLNLPVILIIDAKSTAYSVAPILHGFKSFDPQLEIAGVIFNRVTTASHYQLLKEACEDVGVKVLGHLPVLKDCEIPSRHLGLSLETLEDYNSSIDQIAHKIEEFVELDELLAMVNRSFKNREVEVKGIETKQLKVAVAKDEAFNFTYHQNIKKLEEYAQVTFFSPIHDVDLPEADLLYFPGGYPELYAKELSQNGEMKKAIYAFLHSGGKAFAECGGMMYLGTSLIDKEGNEYEMVNALGLRTSMKPMKLNLGYRKISWDNKELWGHEFHYSTSSEKAVIPSCGVVHNIRDKEVKTKFYLKDNLLASYIHLYFGEDDQFKLIMNLLTISL